MCLRGRCVGAIRVRGKGEGVIGKVFGLSSHRCRLDD